MRKKLFLLLFILCLSVSPAHAITVTSDINSNIGYVAAGESLTFTLTASDYEAQDSSAITWLIKSNEGANPGLKLDRRRGNTVKLSSSSMARTGKDGRFSITVTAQDINTVGTLTITGQVISRPVIRTKGFANVQAGAERDYLQRLDFNQGVEPLELTISGDFPEGLRFGEAELQGRNYHVVTGNTNQTGTFEFTLIAQNPVGTDSKTYTLESLPVKAKIKAPKDFPKEYVVSTGVPFFIDLSGFQFSGTRPLSIDVDERAKGMGISYDGDKKSITGSIPEGTKTRKLNVKLSSANRYGKPASTTFTLNIKSLAYGIKTTPASQRLQHITEGSTDIYVMPVNLGRVFASHFRASTGTKPITWDYVITSMDESINGKRIVKDLGGKFGGLSFDAEGNITGTPSGSGHVIFTAEASNPAGVVESDMYEYVFGRSPSFDRAKTAIPVRLLNGRSASVNPADYIAPADNGRFGTTFEVTGSFPPGMSFDGTNITGTPSASSPAELKRYTLYVAATNAFGTSHGRINIELQDAPRIGGIPDTVTGKVGTALRLVLPAEATRPYTWRMVCQGEEVSDEIGDSGIKWNPRTGAISGSGSLMLEGTYRVTVYLKNDVGEDSRTFTIQVNP